MTIDVTAPADAADQAQALGETLADVEAAQAGDRAAFERLYRAYAPMVHGIVLAYVDWSEAEDLVQDAFVVAHHRLPQLSSAAAFGAWLAQIARRRATDRIRRTRPASPLPPAVPGREQADDRARALLILDRIREVPAAYRETLVMRLVQGMTGPEIAEKTGMTAGSVRVNLHRGMTQLRRLLAGGDDD